jgi:hypothetical protein
MAERIRNASAARLTISYDTGSEQQHADQNTPSRSWESRPARGVLKKIIAKR